MSNTDEICLGPVEAIPPGTGRAFTVGERTIAIFRTLEGTLYAAQNACPHAGSALAGGRLGTTNVICPRHGWKFNLNTGICTHDPGYRIRVYQVREGDGAIYVTVR